MPATEHPEPVGPGDAILAAVGERNEIEDGSPESGYTETLGRDDSEFTGATEEGFPTESENDKPAEQQLDCGTCGEDETVFEAGADEVSRPRNHVPGDGEESKFDATIRHPELSEHGSHADRDLLHLPARKSRHPGMSQLMQDEQDTPGEEKQGHAHRRGVGLAHEIEGEEESEKEREDHKDSPLIPGLWAPTRRGFHAGETAGARLMRQARIDTVFS